MRQLIVNADDFGLTGAVSSGILDAHRNGIVTSTTLMANGGAFDAAVAMGRRAPRLGIGVHLNLTSGEPVSPAQRIPSLLDRSGRLHWSAGRLLRDIVTRQVDLAEAETELRRQIIKVRRAGILPTHLDGHKHVHVMPGVSDIVMRLAQEFSIPCVRCPREVAPNLPTLLRSGNPRNAVIKQYLVGRIVFRFARVFEEKLANAGLLSGVDGARSQATCGRQWNSTYELSATRNVHTGARRCGSGSDNWVRTNRTRTISTRESLR